VGVVNANKRNKLIISVDLMAFSWLMLAALVLFSWGCWPSLAREIHFHEDLG